MRSKLRDVTNRKTIAGQWVSTGTSGYLSNSTNSDHNITVKKTATGFHELTFHDFKFIDGFSCNVSGYLQGYSVINLYGGNKVGVALYRFTGEAQDWHFSFTAEGALK